MQSLKPFTRGVLEGTVQGRDGPTPFAWWAGRYGLWPPAVLAALVVATAVSMSRWRGAVRRRATLRDRAGAT